MRSGLRKERFSIPVTHCIQLAPSSIVYGFLVSGLIPNCVLAMRPPTYGFASRMRKSVIDALWSVWAAVIPATPAPRMATLVLRQVDVRGKAENWD